MKSISSLILFVLLALPFAVLSQADNTGTNGNWNNAGTWSAGVPTDGTPGNETVVHIPSGATVTMTDQITLNDVVLVIEGELQLNFNWGTFQYAQLNINGANAGVVLTGGSLLDDGTLLGYDNVINVNGSEIWGGANSGAPNTGDYNASSEESYGSVTGSASELLPVELIRFDVVEDQGKVQLLWQTASEKDNHGFEVQRSYDGKEFETLGFIEGHGTTTDLQSYSFEHVASNSAYYRLRQVDFDGKYEFSPIRYIQIRSAHTLLPTQLDIYPNPTHGAITIKGALTNYALYDESGRLIISKENTTAFYAQSEISDFLQLQRRGKFYLVSFLNGERIVSRIVKQ